MAALHALCFETPRPWSATEFTDLCAMRGVFLAGTETAFAMGRVIADEAELLTLAVHPGARRAGLGRAQLDRFEATAAAAGARTAFLEVAADNDAARALYRAAGYAESGRRTAYYTAPNGAKIDALILHKPLKLA